MKEQLLALFRVIGYSVVLSCILSWGYILITLHFYSEFVIIEPSDKVLFFEIFLVLLGIFFLGLESRNIICPGKGN